MHSGAGGWQSHGAEVCRGGLWWKHQTHTLHLLNAEDAADPAGEGHHCWVHQKWGFQVRFYNGVLFISNALLLIKPTFCLRVETDMSVYSEQCTWDWRERLWTATNTWSRFTTITERSRLRTGTAVRLRCKTSLWWTRRVLVFATLGCC